jgi:hypothetical protein
LLSIWNCWISPDSKASSNSCFSSGAGCRCSTSKIVRPMASVRETPCSPVSRLWFQAWIRYSPVDHVEPDRQGVHDALDELPLVGNLADAGDHLTLELAQARIPVHRNAEEVGYRLHAHRTRRGEVRHPA